MTSRRKAWSSCRLARNATSCSSLHSRIRPRPLLLAAEKRSLVDMDQDARREIPETKPPKPARVALNVLALCFALSVLGRGLGESFTVFLKPIAESFGWDRAQVVSVYSLTALAGGLGAPHRLFARTAAAGRRISDRRPCARALAVPVERRPVRGNWHCVHRQRTELHPARPLVWPAIADRDGHCIFGDRRRRVGAAAGLPDPDRSFGLARRLPDFRRRRAASAAAVAAVAVAAVRDRLAEHREKGRSGFHR